MKRIYHDAALNENVSFSLGRPARVLLLLIG
jgi:hypothetical protein